MKALLTTLLFITTVFSVNAEVPDAFKGTWLMDDCPGAHFRNLVIDEQYVRFTSIREENNDRTYRLSNRQVVEAENQDENSESVIRKSLQGVYGDMIVISETIFSKDPQDRRINTGISYMRIVGDHLVSTKKGTFFSPPASDTEEKPNPTEGFFEVSCKFSKVSN